MRVTLYIDIPAHDVSFTAMVKFLVCPFCIPSAIILLLSHLKFTIASFPHTIETKEVYPGSLTSPIAVTVNHPLSK